MESENELEILEFEVHLEPPLPKSFAPGRLSAYEVYWNSRRFLGDDRSLCGHWERDLAPLSPYS